MTNGVIKKRSVSLAGHLTSVSVEDEFWAELKRLAAREGLTVTALLTRLDAERPGNLSSAIRLHVLKALQSQR
jgi:predicted DNA-binding ribbon-helix-helix protein